MHLETQESQGKANPRRRPCVLVQWLREVMKHASLLDDNKVLAKSEFKEKGFLGSGGLARFRDTLWAAAIGTANVATFDEEEIRELAAKHRHKVRSELVVQQ